ncbi:hypothetical protein [Enterobacter cloacae]|uniref:hypothetical protein n=1 Tax=Enterobacter cloacae TaxID=550 RepID=UPI002B213B96|nr:hypothetical protein [Enterobacter cloacae]MEA5217585.1 hypothetical protein [Enterobacter cloacae]
MTQISFADFFNEAKTLGAPPVVQAAPAVQTVPARTRLISIDTARKQFISLFNQTARHLHRWDVFSDFVRLAASELDIARVRTPENAENCRKICARYDVDDIRNFHELFRLMVCALEAKFHDFIGSIFMELDLQQCLCRYVIFCCEENCTASFRPHPVFFSLRFYPLT